MLTTTQEAPRMPPDTNAKRETWVDWMPEGAPEPEVFSRDELLELLRDRGIDITPSALEHWRRNGVLPRPVHRRHGGITIAVYPGWFVGAIEHLKHLQGMGKSLDEIKPWMRSWALTTVSWRDPLAEPITNARAALTDLVRAHGITAGGVLRVTFTNDDGDVVLNEDWPVTPEG